MFGIKYLKSKPGEFVMLVKKGKIKKMGNGLSFFYHAPTSSLVLIPMASRDTPFIFQESTSDFQTIDVQGQITYRVKDAQKLSVMLDFSLAPDGHYTGDGLEKLPVRLTNLTQIVLREKLQSMDLKQVLTTAFDLVSFATERLKNANLIGELGLEILDFSILGIHPTPEIAKALEASSRENLLKDADDAIYQRRNFAVEQERKIKENELQTQISIEEKNRLIREEQMNAEIAVQEKQQVIEEAKMISIQAVEKKRAQIAMDKIQSGIEQENVREQLVVAKSKNTLAEAKTHTQAMKMQLDTLAQLNPDYVNALIESDMQPHQMISKAIRELAQNAEKIGSLNFSPELLASLLDKPKQ